MLFRDKTSRGQLYLRDFTATTVHSYEETLSKAWGYAEEPQGIIEDYRPFNIWNCSGLTQGGAKHHTAIHAFPHSVIREKAERGESVRTHGLRWGQFKKVMHDAVAHCQPNDAPANSPRFCCSPWCHMFLWSVWVSCSASVPFQPPIHLQLTHCQSSTRSWKVLEQLPCTAQ